MTLVTNFAQTETIPPGDAVAVRSLLLDAVDVREHAAILAESSTPALVDRGARADMLVARAGLSGGGHDPRWSLDVWDEATAFPGVLDSGDVAAVGGSVASANCNRYVAFLRPRRRSVSDEARKSALLLVDATNARRSRDAYDIFDQVMSLVAQSPAAMNSIASYLRDDRTRYKAVLLSCLADNDVEIEHASTLFAISRLCGNTDLDVARAAAAALESGGSFARAMLNAALLALPDARRREVTEYLLFVAAL